MQIGTTSFFEATELRVVYKLDQFNGLMLVFLTKACYRNGTVILNKIRRVNDRIIETTFRNSMEREGKSIQQCMKKNSNGNN